MGGAMEIVNSAMGVLPGMGSTEGKTAISGQYQSLKAEREAQEASQLQRETDERSRERDKLSEARELEAKRLAAGSKRKTMLGNGGAGLINDPEVDVPQLKTKFGE